MIIFLWEELQFLVGVDDKNCDFKEIICLTTSTLRLWANLMCGSRTDTTLQGGRA